MGWHNTCEYCLYKLVGDIYNVRRQDNEVIAFSP